MALCVNRSPAQTFLKDFKGNFLKKFPLARAPDGERYYMKLRIFAFLLCLALLAPAAVLHPAATIYSGKALDEDFIRNDNSSGTGGSDSDIDPDAPPIEEPDPTPSEDLNNDQALSLAPNYHIMYELNTETKVLRVYCDPSYAKGEQEMLPYSKAAWIPWIKYRKDVETAYIEEGVLSVGRYSFFRCENLKTVYLPHSTTKVEKIVFYLCRNLETIYYAGTEEDFRNNVTWVDYQNIVGGENDPAKDKIHFGEHVKVECKNQDGYTFSAYTVGGYNVGDAYTVAAKTFPGLTLESQSSFAGNFKRGDDSTYTFTYRCDHHFVKNDPDKPCADVCEHCGMPNPEGRDHTWLTEVLSKRSFTEKGEIHEVCTVCGAEKTETKPAYFWYVLIGAGALGVIGGVSFAIAHPIRKKKKLRELTW